MVKLGERRVASGFSHEKNVGFGQTLMEYWVDGEMENERKSVKMVREKIDL